MVSLELPPYNSHRPTTTAIVSLPRNVKLTSPRTSRNPVLIISLVIAFVNVLFGLYLLIVWLDRGMPVHTGDLWYNYTVSCQEPTVAIGGFESSHVDAVNVFISAYPPGSDNFTLGSNTCQAFRDPNLDSAVWICNHEETETEFVPGQILDILTNVLLANPCSYAGMDIEFQSGQKYVIIQGTESNAAEITDGSGGDTGAPTSQKRDANLVGDACFEGGQLPNIDDCTGILNTMNQSSPGTYYFHSHGIMSFVHNTCAMNLANENSAEISIDNKEMVENVTAKIIPCLINGFLGRALDVGGVEVQLKYVEKSLMKGFRFSGSSGLIIDRLDWTFDKLECRFTTGRSSHGEVFGTGKYDIENRRAFVSI